MKRAISIAAFAFVCGAVAGAGIVTPVHQLKAAGSPPAYVVYEANVTDQDGYKNVFLKSLASKLGEVKFLARGGKTQQFIGTAPENRIVIGQYKDMDAAVASYQAGKSDFDTLAPKYATGIRFYAVEGVTE